ncbi:MAG TPA: glycine oxidase ThiO [Vicinamibacterales bacterium]
MPRSIVVVGSGIVGCAIARELAVRGMACAVYDDRPVAGGATQASAGMLAPYVEAHERTPMHDLCVRSLVLYDEWVDAVRAESAMEVEYRRVGTLEVAFDSAEAARLRAAAERSEDVVRVWLDSEAVRREHAAIGDVAGGLFTAVHGYVAAPQLAAALAASAQRHGAALHRAPVERIDRVRSSLRVTTATGQVHADVVVLAAGAWTNAIAGVRTPPVRPIRGQLLHLGPLERSLATIVWGPECYIVPRTDGSLLVGATVEDVGFDERATAAGVRDLLDAACDLLPGAWGASFLDARVGMRPATPDELPVIGPDSEVDGVVHASGHYRNGVLLAPITGRLIADWIADGTRDPAFDTFRSDRFPASA